MSSDRIYLESDIQDISQLFHVKPLNQIHKELEIQKPCIYYIVTDDELLQLNKQVLNHDYYTDIITFDYEDDEDIDENEIVISWDRIQDNALTLKQDIQNEFNRVCIHGLLHLAGYKDKTKIEQLEMTKAENKYLKKYCAT